MQNYNNGDLVDRIAEVLGDGKVDQQTVNRLILETMGHVTKMIATLSNRVDQALQLETDRRIQDNKENTERATVNRNLISALTLRVDRMEKILLFPANHPKITGMATFVIFILMNMWFISGFRELLLEALNAPEWLIELLVGSHVVTPAP